MLSYETIRVELDKMCILLQKQIPDQELDIISLEWQEVFQNITAKMFSTALRKHRDISAFFPTQADVLKQIALLKAAEPSCRKPIEEDQNASSFEYTKVWATLAKKALQGDKQAKEFFRKNKAEKHLLVQDFFEKWFEKKG